MLIEIQWIIYVVFAALGLAISFAIGQHVLSKEHETTKVGLVEQEKLRLEAKKAKKARDVEAGVPVVQAAGDGEKALA